MISRFWLVAVGGLATVAALQSVETVAVQQRPATARWITAWGTSQQGAAATPLTNATIRMIAKVTIAGDAVRVRIDNAFGTAPLSIGKAYVGVRIQGAALAAGSNRPISFNQAPGVVVPKGGSVVSDPVPMKVLARQDLAVSLYLPDTNVQPSQHAGAQVTSFMTPAGAGDATADEAATAFKSTTTSMLGVKAIDILSSSSLGAIVAFGDSITDGTCTTVDAHDRWEDWLAVRLALDAAARGTRDVHKAVVNEGIGGNTITREALQPPPDSPPGLERLERDALSHQGTTHVVLFMGTNDIRREAPASQVIAGMQEIIRRVKARGLKIVGVTIIPRHNRAPVENNTGWNPAKTRFRNEVNQWIRTKAGFDAVIDFDAVTKAADDPDRINPSFDCGDGIHPSPLGYYEMGKFLRLDMFN